MPLVEEGHEAQQSNVGRRDLAAATSSQMSVADVFARALWDGRWIVLAAAIVGGILGVIVARSISPRYEASTTILVAEPTPQDAAAVSNPQTVRAVAESNAVVARVLSELGLDKAPYTLTPVTFRAGSLAIEEVRGTRMLRVKVTLSDPALATRAADATARAAVELSRTLNRQDTVYLRDYLKAQLDAAQTRKTQLERDMLAHRGTSQLELLAADADALIRERGQLLRLVVDIAAEEARVATVERELSGRDRILRAPRLPEIESALSRLGRDDESAATPADGSPTIVEHREAYKERQKQGLAPPLDSESPPVPYEAIGEFVNPVFEILDYQAAAGRARLAALRRQRDELISVRKLNADQVQTLSSRYRAEIELRKLQTEYDLAEKIYLDLSLKHEQARVKAVSSSADAQILDPALQPTEPVAPRRRRIVAAGGVAGLLLGLTVVTAGAALRSRRSR